MPSGNPNGNPKPQYDAVVPKGKRAAYQRAYYDNHREKCITDSRAHKKEHPLICRYDSAKSCAKKRGILWALDKGQWLDLVSKPCTYSLHGETGQRIGVDRIESSKGYELGNCQPCCYRHNTVKGNVFTHEQMLDLVFRYGVLCGNKPASRNLTQENSE